MAGKKPDEIAAALLTRIVDGEFERLPREGDLAEFYAVAKGTAREARRALADRGVVEVDQGRAGATILPVAQWSLFELPILDAILAGPGSADLVDEAIECRQLLEPHAAALAAVRAGPEHVEALEQALERMRAAAKLPARAAPAVEGRRRAERDFRRAVLDAAGNRFLARALLSLAHAAPPTRTISAKSALAQHAALHDAIRSGDAVAARSAMHARLDALR